MNADAVPVATLPAPREMAGEKAIRPFRAHVPDADLVDLRRRLAASRWPDKETVADQSQGAQLAELQELVRYWATRDVEQDFGCDRGPPLQRAPTRTAERLTATPRNQESAMNTHTTTETIDRDRRRLLSTATMGIVALGVANLLPSHLMAASAGDAIRPFRINIPEEQLVDLRKRINAARWPDGETVNDGSQGPQLAKFQEAMRYWATDYDWRKVEARLNALPQFISEIDGLDIHFIHVRSKHEDALPLIVTHGWPGSIIEQLKIVDPLTNPTARGGKASDAFHLVIPSMPGYGFSGKPKGTGWNPDRIARAWAELMKRLGYTRYVAQGGDWGAPVSSAMARQASAGLLGIHINLPATVPSDVAMALAGGGPAPAGLSEKERAAFDSLDTFFKKYRAYGAIMGTRPQAIGYGLADSPVGLAAWIYDYNDGEPASRLHRDDVLDDITLYWLTNTATSAARLYWETAGQSVVLSAAQKTTEISLPVAITVFPGEVYRAPETWARRAYRNLIYFNEVDKGGHFAAWEQPELFAAELRAAFRSLRPAH